ncbi:hypothetical protein [Mesobacillus stamsii]|uniref:Uncharacterized protein n=1 Tax=Mesobacillus stamsii TaxID=225347 RepID=A0ABU0FVW2_9BACI|nr:hypothetical protein [Mesobacillus stamsii]MDQ0414049.1 hypothetical protein [Mesobacillus stamsii]
MKKTVLFLCFVLLLSLLSSSVSAQKNEEFVPDPKPDDAYYNDQFEQRKAMYLKEGYKEVDVTESNQHVAELLKTGQITAEDLRENRITVLEKP